MSETEKLKEYLFDSKKYGWDSLSDEQKQAISKFSDEYIYFLNNSKTERDATEFIVDVLNQNGFVDLRDKMLLTPGDKVYFVNRFKAIYALNETVGKIIIK